VKPLLFTIWVLLAASGTATGARAAAAPLSGATGRAFPASAAARAGRPLERVAAANAAALLEPARAAYVNAAQIYPWQPGRLYRLYTAPGTVSDIALQAGEGLVSVAAGDTLRWVIGNTVSGSGASRQTHILIKPASAGLQTNLVIATDRRVYLVELESTPGPAMAAISWSYPADSMRRFGVSEEQIVEGRCTQEFCELMKFEVDRTAALFDEGERLVPMLDASVQRQVALFGQGGRAVLEAIRRQDYDTLTRRPVISNWQKGKLVAGALATSLAAKFVRRSA